MSKKIACSLDAVVVMALLHEYIGSPGQFLNRADLPQALNEEKARQIRGFRN